MSTPCLKLSHTRDMPRREYAVMFSSPLTPESSSSRGRVIFSCTSGAGASRQGTATPRKGGLKAGLDELLEEGAREGGVALAQEVVDAADLRFAAQRQADRLVLDGFVGVRRWAGGSPVFVWHGADYRTGRRVRQALRECRRGPGKERLPGRGLEDALLWRKGSQVAQNSHLIWPSQAMPSSSSSTRPTLAKPAVTVRLLVHT